MKKGQLITLDKEKVLEICKGRENSTGESYVFENMDLNKEQVSVIITGQEEEILGIDSDGDIRFYGLPGTYPREIFE